MSREYCHINSSLSNYFRNIFWGVVQLQLDGQSLQVANFYLLSSLPATARLAPDKMIKFVNVRTNTYFKGQKFLMLDCLFQKYSALSNDQDVFHYYFVMPKNLYKSSYRTFLFSSSKLSFFTFHRPFEIKLKKYYFSSVFLKIYIRIKYL